MSHKYYKKSVSDKQGELPAIEQAGKSLRVSEKSFKNRATKMLEGIGTIGTPSEADMALISKLMPDTTVKADDLFVWPVMMANDLEDRHLQRFDKGTLRGFVDLPESLGVVGKSLIVAHGANLFNRDGSGIPEGRIYHAEVVQDPNNINPITNEPTNWLVGRIYMTRTADMEDTIQKIRAGVLSFVSVGVIVEKEIDPNTGNEWGWDYYQSEDGTVRRELTGVGVLTGAKEFVELSYKITLGAQYGAGVAGAYKDFNSNSVEPEIELKTVEAVKVRSEIMKKFQIKGVEIEVNEATHVLLTEMAGEAQKAADLSTKLNNALQAKTQAESDKNEADAAKVAAEQKAETAEKAKEEAEEAKAAADKKVEAAEAELKGIKSALLERLKSEAVTAGDDEEGAQELVELYADKSIEQISARVQKFVTRKGKTFEGGRKSDPSEGDDKVDVQQKEAEVRGQAVVGSLFGSK